MTLFFFTAFKGTLLKKLNEGELFDLKQTRTTSFITLASQKNLFPLILVIRGMTFEFGYPGEFEFTFENIFGCELVAHIWSIQEKKQRNKISCKCTFKAAGGGEGAHCRVGSKYDGYIENIVNCFSFTPWFSL
jgi:hypothetical protein